MRTPLRFGLLAVLIVTFPWLAATASAPGTCTDTQAECTPTNTCTGSPCQIAITRAGLANGTVSPYINGTATPLAFFCVAPSSSNVVWITSDATSFSDVRFSSTNAFGKTSFGSDSLNNSAPAPVSGAGCYTFAVSNCTYDGTQCGNTDPRVVIKSSGIKKKRHAEEHKDKD